MTITDGDPDDGIPSNPTLNNDPNVVRSNDGTAAAWTDLSVEVTGGPDCISKISSTAGSYTAGSSSSQSIAVITIRADGDAPVNSCALTIRATGEDGQLVAPVGVDVTVQPAPSFVGRPAFTPATLTDAFDYDNPDLTISGMVITNDDDSVFPTVTLTSLDTRCSLTQTSFTNPSDQSPYSFTSSVIPSDTGTCRIKAVTMEDGVITEDTVTITFPELTPTVVANPAVVNPANANPAISGLIALQGRSVSIVVNATKRDLGTSVVEFPRSITSAVPACTASIGNGGGGNLVVDYTNNQPGAIASVTYTVTSASAINCGAFTFTATEDSKIGTAATLSGVSFVSPASVAPTLTLNTGASMLNVRANALGSINLSIARNGHLLTDAIANPTLVVTASVPANATCTATLTDAPIYSGNPQTATADFSVDWTGDEVNGGLCPITIRVEEQDRILVDLPLAATTLNFGAIPQQVGLEIRDRPAGDIVLTPANLQVTVTATVTKRDILTGPNTGVIFRKPVLVGNNLPNYCVVISPTSDTLRDFTPNVLGAEETLKYVFGVNPALRGRASNSCEWRISATSQGVSDTEVDTIIIIPFGIINQLPLLSVGEVATNVYPDDGAVPINLTLTKRDDGFNTRVLTAVRSIAGLCSVDLAQQAVYPSTGFDAIGIATHNITFIGDKTSGETCVLNEFTATEDGLTTTVNEERSIRFLPEVLPSIAFNIDGNSFAPSSSFVVLNVTLTKQDAGNNRELTIPSIVRSSACTAILIGNAPARFAGGIGSNVRLSYNVTSTSGSSASCGNFPFNFAEGTTAVMQGYSGISFTSPLGNSEPAIQVAVLGDRVVADFANVTINVTATNRDQQGERVTFPQTVMSTSPVCVANLAAGFNTTVDYSGSITNLTASVQYIVMPNTEINCGDFTFTATEDGLIGSPFSPLSGISFLDSTKPPTVFAVVNNRRVLPGEMVEIIVTATKVDDYGDQQVHFPQVVNSSTPVCTATLTSASTATQNYASNQAGAMANVGYTVTSPVAILCGDFTFNATEDGLVGSTPPVSGIALFDPSITSPTLESAIVFDTTNPSSPSARVSIIITRRSHLITGALPNPIVGITAISRIFSCDAANIMNRETYSGFPGVISLSYNLNFLQNPLIGGNCELEVFVDEPGQGQVTSTIRVKFLPGVAQLDFSTDLDGTNAVVNPATEYTNDTLTITATATKGDNVAEDGRRGVIFRSILASSTPTGACVVMSPTASIPSTGGDSSIIDFPDTILGSQTNFNYNFGVAEGFQTQSVTCEWSVSATAEHSPGANAGTTSVYLKFVPSGNLPPSFVIEQGNTTRFPDEGLVQYTLTITKQDEIGDGRLAVTPTTLDACRIIPPAQPPAYQNRMATATYGVEYAGAVNATGDAPGGTCVVSFAVAEDGAKAPVQQRSITFNTELAPNIDVQVIGNRVNVPADQTVNVSVTATKQDNSNTMAVTFPREIRSSSSCLATLAGNELRQYNGILAGSSSVTVTYMVAASLNGGDCGDLVFIATEGSATVTHILSSGISFNIVDGDGDGLLGADDVDEDGDGLIEIATAEDLNQVRDDLAGSSFSGNSSGCGGSFHTNGSRIQECSGYELVADIDLAAAGYDNWNPIGRNPAFTAIFEGNDHTISNSNINSSSGENWGFFGSINNAFIRNVHLRNINTMSSGNNVGGLVGLADGTSMIINSSVTASLVQGGQNVGGLVGKAANDVQIISSYAEIKEVAGADIVGGLVGRGEGVAIKLSYVRANTLSVSSAPGVTKSIGGMVGIPGGANIASSTAMVSNITLGESAYIGGLVGGNNVRSNLGADLSFSSGIINNFIARGAPGFIIIGGAVSIHDSGSIHSSYVVTKTSKGGILNHFGFVGFGSGSFRTTYSYWDSVVLTPSDSNARDIYHYGEGKTTTELQGTTDFSDIYSAWGNGWCDVATNEFTTNSSSPLATIPNADANRFWDLGAADEYPAMNCLPNFTPAEQRAAMTRVLNDESPLRN
ncbi:MAG: hypothetical protein K0U41_04245 [Gammaproteobacteria bacterium]|nr:hypothetical protein [Gammaproteobacteria bacterium]